MVTLVASSSADDWLTGFQLGTESVQLVSQSGNTVTLWSKAATVEEIGANSSPVPLATASIPADTYTSVKVTWSTGQFMYVGLQHGTNGAPDTTTTYTNRYNVGSAVATANLSAPIVVQGPAMYLRLDLQVSSSVTMLSLNQFKVTPTFNLSFGTLSLTDTLPINNLYGRVSSVNGSQVALTGLNADVTVNLGATAYEGITGAGDLKPGMFVRLDGTLQPDGTVNASDLQVPEPMATTALVGTTIAVTPSSALVGVVHRSAQGDDTLEVGSVGGEPYSTSSATFLVSAPAATLADLPFTARFDAGSIVNGQAIWLAEHPSTTSSPYRVVTTMMLIPQTINGRIAGVGTAGAYTVYTVVTAANDYATRLNGAAYVQVYLKGNASWSVGTVARFTGLLFDDGGTLRMAATSTDTGVTAQPSEAGSVAAGNMTSPAAAEGTQVFVQHFPAAP